MEHWYNQGRECYSGINVLPVENSWTFVFQVVTTYLFSHKALTTNSSDVATNFNGVIFRLLHIIFFTLL